MTNLMFVTVEGPEFLTTKETEKVGPSWSTLVIEPLGGTREYVNCSGDTILQNLEEHVIGRKQKCLPRGHLKTTTTILGHTRLI